MKLDKKITYSSSGVNYSDIDPIKKLAQTSAAHTGINLKKSGFSEVSATRGESAYVWQQGNILMASVIEGLGTKNLVADAMKKNNGKTYYDIVAHDTVATIINDLVSVGAKPLSLHAYWAVGDSKWLSDKQRMKDLISGWKSACDIAGVSWGGGETPAYAGIINPDTIDLAGSAVGIIKNKANLLIDKKIKAGDRIIFLKSNGINANGLSLARALAKKLPSGYSTKLKNKKTFGESLLTKSNIYANLVQDLFKNKIDVHYLSNITGHGLRKVMRGRPNFTYVIEKIFAPQELFHFIQSISGMNDYEMYQTFNMGQDYAIFVPQKDVTKTLKVIKQNKFTGLDAGYVHAGAKQVVIKPKKLVYKGDTLDLR
ncbi:MAG: AIR synthase related protein [Candidatus Magasanikbacteria bacterium]|nr:AIR synthase related protein [Candidatus Magasanikbacteria bacterium]